MSDASRSGPSPPSSAQRAILGTAFAAYCLLVIAGAAVHEPWWDESHAWLIARDASLTDLFTRDVAFEGHPPLWFLVLRIPAKLGLHFWSMKIVAALCGMAGVWLLLFRFPAVPLAIRVLAPFSFYVAYQYTIVARSYVLMAPVLWWIAWLYDRRGERFGTFVALLILLSWVSVHGLALACALAVLFLTDVATRRISLESLGRGTILLGVSAFVLSTALLVAMLWPPAGNPAYSSIRSPFDAGRILQLIPAIAREFFWGVDVSPYGFVEILKVLLAAAAAAALLLWLRSAGLAGTFLLLTAAVFAVATVYYSAWHEGLFFFVLLFTILIACSRAGGMHRAALAATVLLLLQHVHWTARSIDYDVRHDFTGSLRAAAFLAKRGIHERTLFGFGLRAFEIQPYFPANIFENYRFHGHAYWSWSPENEWPFSQGTRESRAAMRRWYDAMRARRPEYIVASIGFRDDHLYAAELTADSEYRTIATFAGRMFWKTRPGELIAFRVFERRDLGPRSRRAGEFALQGP